MSKMLSNLKEQIRGALPITLTGLVSLAGLAGYLGISHLKDSLTEINVGKLERKLEAIQSSKSQKGDKYALLVTGGCPNKEMHEGIQTSFQALTNNGYNPSNIVVLFERGQEKSFPVDGAATETTVGCALNSLAKKIGTNDSFVFFYNGHGGREKIGTNEVSNLSLIDSEFNQVKFMEKLGKINPKQGIVFIDACYSGGFPLQMKELSNRPYVSLSSCTNTSSTATPIIGHSALYHFVCPMAKGGSVEEGYKNVLKNRHGHLVYDHKNKRQVRGNEHPELLSNGPQISTGKLNLAKTFL